MRTRVLRVTTILSVLALATILFQAPQAAAVAPADADGDGLSDAFEQGTWYRQVAAVAGLPLNLPNNGQDVVSIELERPQWAGTATRAFLELRVDHAASGDLAVAVGFGNAGGWVDRLVWVPGAFGKASIWDMAVAPHMHPHTGCVDWHLHFDPFDMSIYPHCHAYGTTYTRHDHSYAARDAPAAMGQRITLSTADWPTNAAVTVSGTTHHVRVNLLPVFAVADLQGVSAWRILIRDWNPYGAGGRLLGASLILEERSHPNNPDTDGDGVRDGTDVEIGAFPVARDTDADGLTDRFEEDPRYLPLVVNGAAIGRRPQTDPSLWDTDGDGLGDGEERSTGLDNAVTDPAVADTDGDGLSDGAEATEHQSDPTHRDTDGDGLLDGDEVRSRPRSLRINGIWRTRSITTLPYAPDSDGDGLKDGEEWFGTSVYGVVTDPSDPDTDDDGLPDGQERYLQEVNLPTRVRLGYSRSVYLTAWPSGSIEKAEVRYGLSSIAVSNFYLRLYKGLAAVTLKNHGGSGTNEFASLDITGSFVHGGTYRLYVSSWVPNGVLEEFALSFTQRTSPVRTDSDGDGLTDGEEVTHGSDGWVTDPNRPDTDGDGWRDGYELQRGTSPLARDTDGDGAPDPRDLDPLRNLLVRVFVRQVHQANPGCTPTLAGVVRVNDDYTWVTPHKRATGSAFTAYLCGNFFGSTEYQRASFWTTYYADVPDDVASVRIGASAWSLHWWGDDLLVDRAFTYTLKGYRSATLYNGPHWISLTVTTASLGKVRTLALTDGEMTVQAANGQYRYAAQDRFLVFLVEATSSYGSIPRGMQAFLVPRVLFMESRLKDRLGDGYTWPVGDTKFYAEGSAQGDISEAVTAVTAGKMTGSRAHWLLQYLLQDVSGVKARNAVDVTAYATLVNLPTDALTIIPWLGVANSVTGPMPQNFWQKISSAASGLVNAIVQAGQLVWGGLIAVSNFFVALGQAVVDWGMKLIGTYLQTLVAVHYAIQRTLEILGETVRWAIEAATSAIQAALEAVLDSVQQMIDENIGSIVEDIRIALNSPEDQSSRAIARASNQVLFLLPAIALVPMTVRAVEVGIQASTLGVSWGIGQIISKIVAETIVRTLVFTAVSLAIINLFGDILERIGWVEEASLQSARDAGISAAVIATVSKVTVTFLRTTYWKSLEFNKGAMIRWSGFAMAVLSLFLVLYGVGVEDAGLRAAIDLTATGLAFLGLMIYVFASKRNPSPIFDVFSVIGKTMERLTVFGSPAVAAGTLAFRAATGEYDG